MYIEIQLFRFANGKTRAVFIDENGKARGHKNITPASVARLTRAVFERKNEFTFEPIIVGWLAYRDWWGYDV